MDLPGRPTGSRRKNCTPSAITKQILQCIRELCEKVKRDKGRSAGKRKEDQGKESTLAGGGARPRRVFPSRATASGGGRGGGGSRRLLPFCPTGNNLARTKRLVRGHTGAARRFIKIPPVFRSCASLFRHALRPAHAAGLLAGIRMTSGLARRPLGGRLRCHEDTLVRWR